MRSIKYFLLACRSIGTTLPNNLHYWQAEEQLKSFEKAELSTPLGGFARVGYHDECEAAINDQIKCGMHRRNFVIFSQFICVHGTVMWSRLGNIVRFGRNLLITELLLRLRLQEHSLRLGCS